MQIDQLRFACTNENPVAILEGLDIQSTDRLLAVGGSGDQAFALVEYADTVTVADNNPAQVDYIRKRARALLQGDTSSFLDTDTFGTDDAYPTATHAHAKKERMLKYFQSGGRLEQIKNRLALLDIRDAQDFFTIAAQTHFNKAYLSNIATFIDWRFDDIRILLNRMPVDGLLYVTDAESRIILQQMIETRLSSILVFDEQLSQKARHIEEWSPGVFRKVG